MHLYRGAFVEAYTFKIYDTSERTMCPWLAHLLYSYTYVTCIASWKTDVVFPSPCGPPPTENQFAPKKSGIFGYYCFMPSPTPYSCNSDNGNFARILYVLPIL